NWGRGRVKDRAPRAGKSSLGRWRAHLIRSIVYSHASVCKRLPPAFRSRILLWYGLGIGRLAARVRPERAAQLTRLLRSSRSGFPLHPLSSSPAVRSAYAEFVTPDTLSRYSR